MASLTLRDLDIRPTMIDIINKAGLHTPLDIVTYSSGELARLTHLSLDDVEQLVSNVAHQLNKTLIVDAAELEGEAPFLASLCPSLERMLRGGIRTRHITEIVGDAGSGKTQLCLQLALAVQMPENGLPAGAVYLCTEGKFPDRRLAQMVQHKQNEMKKTGIDAIPSFLNRIFIQHIPDQRELHNYLRNYVPPLLARNNVRLLIIDSVAALFRSDYSADEFLARSRDLQSVGQELHQLCAQYQIAILCVNQVTANMSSGANGGNLPSLGLVWANIIHTRLSIKRTDTEAKVSVAGKEFKSTVREVTVEFSPYLPPGNSHFLITDCGIKSVRHE